MENISNQDSTLVELLADFLLTLSPQDKEETQAEVYKFIRWLGLHRKASELSPVDIASYGELLSPSATKLVRAFLSYIRKRGLTRTNLATHVRARKASSKAAVWWRSSQSQTVLTAQGYAKLAAELAKLKNQRSEVIEEIRRAAADKDFRENAPLEAAREQKARLEGRMEELESTLKLAGIMAESQSTSKAKIGDRVLLYDLSSGKELSYVLVAPREANPSKGKISLASPLGKVLLDKEKGQIVEVAAPAGVFSYRIEDIQPG